LGRYIDNCWVWYGLVFCTSKMSLDKVTWTNAVVDRAGGRGQWGCGPRNLVVSYCVFEIAVGQAAACQDSVGPCALMLFV
jgi:hypothetical protein